MASNQDTLVTVFGGSGFLGRNVVRALCKRDYRIRVAVRTGDTSQKERAATKTKVFTRGFAPIEQIAGNPETRSDLYALAATLYHLATGKDPSDSATAQALGSQLAAAAAAQRDPGNPTSWGKVGRNENCPCGSGKKYKHCHGRFG